MTPQSERRSSELGRRARIMQMSGLSRLEIASKLNASLDDVDRWLDHERFDAPRPRETVARDSPARARMRLSSAKDLLSQGGFLTVVPAGESGSHQIGICIGDRMSTDLSDVVDELVTFISRIPGVASAAREDREFVAVTTSSQLDLDSLTELILDWAQTRLRAVAAGDDTTRAE